MTDTEHLERLKSIDKECQLNQYARHVVAAEDIQWAVKQIERAHVALKTIYWTLPATNPQAWHMKEFARKGLYGK
jgi:hypothetical protein